MEKERKIEAPAGCEIEKVQQDNNVIQIPQGCDVDEIKVVDGFVTITFKEKERKLPKSWEEFCEIYKVKERECCINAVSGIFHYRVEKIRDVTSDRNIFPDRATAEAVLALCQLIQLRNCYNGDWVPDWTDEERKYAIEFYENDISNLICYASSKIFFFKTEELRDEFLRCFRPLIEKLKPLYGIKEGGEE